MPKRNSIDAVEPLNLRFSILIVQFVTKVFSNKEHPLHSNLIIASKKDPRVFNTNHWNLKATHTMLHLLKDSSLPIVQPKLFKIPPWKDHPIEVNIYHPYDSKSKLTPKEACQLAKD